MLEGILCDYDGTMSQSSRRQFEWFKHWSDYNRKEFPFSEIDTFMRFYNEKLNRNNGGIQNVYDALNLPAKVNDRNHVVWKHYEAFKDKHPAGLYDGVKESIRTIREMTSLSADPHRNRRVQMAICTSNTWGSIYNELLANGIKDCFDSKVTFETLQAYHGNGGVPIKKPSKIPVALSLMQMGTDGNATIHVGDSLADLQASIDVKRFGDYHSENLITVGVLWGYEGEKILEGVEMPYGRVNFRHIVERPEQLPGIVAQYL